MGRTRSVRCHTQARCQDPQAGCCLPSRPGAVPLALDNVGGLRQQLGNAMPVGMAAMLADVFTIAQGGSIARIDALQLPDCRLRRRAGSICAGKRSGGVDHPGRLRALPLGAPDADARA